MELLLSVRYNKFEKYILNSQMMSRAYQMINIFGQLDFSVAFTVYSA